MGLGPPLVETHGLVKDYGEVHALGPLDVTLDRGAWGIVGPNGAGKTTFFLTLLGLLQPTRGSVRFLGKDVEFEALSIRSKVGFVPEGDSFLPQTSAVSFVAFCGELSGMRRSDALSRAHEVLEYVGLGEARYRSVDSLSLGTKQKAKLAAALVHDPEVLLLDEPTNGLDPQGRRHLLDLLRELHREHGISLLYSSHVLKDVEEVCDRLLILDRGLPRFVGTVAQLVEEKERAYEVLVEGDGESFVKFLKEEGVEVEEIPSDRTLDSRKRYRLKLPSFAEEERILRSVVKSGVDLVELVPAVRTIEEGFVEALGGGR